MIYLVTNIFFLLLLMADVFSYKIGMLFRRITWDMP